MSKKEGSTTRLRGISKQTQHPSQRGKPPKMSTYQSFVMESIHLDDDTKLLKYNNIIGLAHLPARWMCLLGI